MTVAVVDEPGNANQNSSKKPWMVFVLTLVTQLSMVNLGYDMGSLSGAILLAEEIDYLHLNQLWAQMITAGPMPSGAIFALIGSYLADKYGRKKTLMVACGFYILGSALSGSAPNRESLLAGRILLGCGFGIAATTSSVYVAECSPTQIRGRLIGLSQPVLSTGILIGTVIAALFSKDSKNGWRYIWGIQGVFGFTEFLGLIFLPESPRWLIKESRDEEARKSLMRIRNGGNVEKELQEIAEHFQNVQRSIENSDEGNLIMRMIRNVSVRRALVVGCGLQLFAQFSGVNTVIYYSGIIIKMSGVGNLTNALWNSVIINCVCIVFAVIGVWLVDKLGRRKLAIIGLLGLCCSSLCLGTTFLMVTKYSPKINNTYDLFNNTCSSYSLCDDCVRDVQCGYCYGNISEARNSACLPVSPNSHLMSGLGPCNSYSSLLESSTKWSYDHCPVSFSWIALIGLALFFMFYSLGIGPLPWTVNAEIYPLWARSAGCGLGAMTCLFCNLIVSASFLSFVELIRTYGVFYVMSSVAIIGSAFCILFLPETKSKSLEEIQALFASNKINIC